VMSRQALVKWGVPAVISLGALFYLTKIIDFTNVFAHMTARSAAILVPSLVAYGFFSLAIEAMTLRRLLHSTRADFTLVIAARIKAASYLMTLVHYALGAATLTLLLRRRAGSSLAKSAGVVMLIMMFDLAMVLSMVVVGASFISSTNVKIQFGLIVIIIAVIAGGLALLRAPFSLGPLDRLRELELFQAARTTDKRDLVELAFLRFVFVLGFEMLGWLALHAFAIDVPFGAVMVHFSAVALVSMLPAVAGLGPTQVAMVEFFRNYGTAESLLACSIALSSGMIVLRSLIGIVFAGEFSREAYSAVREAEADSES
jgi:hypothetical protein